MSLGGPVLVLVDVGMNERGFRSETYFIFYLLLKFLAIILLLFKEIKSITALISKCIIGQAFTNILLLDK